MHPLLVADTSPNLWIHLVGWHIRLFGYVNFTRLVCFTFQPVRHSLHARHSLLQGHFLVATCFAAACHRWLSVSSVVGSDREKVFIVDGWVAHRSSIVDGWDSSEGFSVDGWDGHRSSIVDWWDSYGVQC